MSTLNHGSRHPTWSHAVEEQYGVRRCTLIESGQRCRDRVEQDISTCGSRRGAPPSRVDPYQSGQFCRAHTRGKRI